MKHHNSDVWLFGYGSLIWRPDIEYKQSARAVLRGWSRRFWQGSHDHRGTPESPGRVVTLVEEPGAACVGMAFLIDGKQFSETFENLDHREKNGYERKIVELELNHGHTVQGVVYIAVEDNHAWLGPAAAEHVASHIGSSHGPSGANADYLLNLADALRELDTHDEHVFELEALILDSEDLR